MKKDKDSNKTNPAHPETDPMVNKEEVKQSKDNKIDQDYPGFPAAPSTEETIQPETLSEHLTAGSIKKAPGTDESRKKNTHDEIESDGSAGAFEQTELRGELEKQKSKKPKDNSY